MIHPATFVQAVSLTVSDLERSLDFYQQAIGLRLHGREGNVARLGVGGADLLELVGNPMSRPVPGSTGLYHFAILVPSRRHLAKSLYRLAESQTPVSGFADHWVSEAIYLDDPDGNGIEIYRDRPRQEWPIHNSRPNMTTAQLDIDGIMAELGGVRPDWQGLDPATFIGHIHLRVADIAQTDYFYRDLVGLDLVMHFGRQATFLSAGGYHHHLGANTWESAGGRAAPAGAIGLRWYSLKLPNPDEVESVVARLQQAGLPLEKQEAGILVKDPSQNSLLLTS